MGTRSKPFFRVVVSDRRKVPTGRVVENLGFFDPKAKPPVIRIDLERADYWVGTGAQPSPTVKALIERARAGNARAPAARDPGPPRRRA